MTICVEQSYKRSLPQQKKPVSLLFGISKIPRGVRCAKTVLFIVNITYTRKIRVKIVEIIH